MSNRGTNGTCLFGPRRAVFEKLVGAVILPLLCAGVAPGQLRIVSYNTTKNGPHAGLGTVLQAIGEESRNAIARPIDVLLLQEQNGPFGDTQDIVDILNGIYGAGTYAHGNLVGGSTDSDDRQTIVYNSQTIQLMGESTAGTTPSQPRQALRYLLQPVGYGSSAQFYVYNSHYKADDVPAAEAQRLVEANAIRSNADALAMDAHIIYAGDLNFYRSTDDGFERLTSAGNGQALDPINRIGSWHNNSSFADIHSQAPCLSTCPSGFTTGGMDDRFDFQLVTSEFLDGEGLSYIGPTVPGMSGLMHSYHAFGNNGSTYNGHINAGSNTVTFPGVTSYTKTQILDALWSASDHIPVVADWQLPAVMQAVAGIVPPTLNVGQGFQLDVTVSNIANVLVAIGADELDYSLTTSGALSGSYLNEVDMALGAGNVHFVTFDTSTPGMKSGMIAVSSTSQAVQNGLVNIPISFEVLAPGLAGDFNDDGTVDAADYVVWRKNEGTANMLPNDPHGGTIGANQYNTWRTNFGAMSGSGSFGTNAVPEPGGWLLLVMGACLAGLARGTLRG
ncbi:MAG: hypothetical protein WD738_06050 [Pirellulales bacterium]